MKIRRLICAALAASLALCPAAFAADTPKTDRIVTTQNGTGYSVSSVGRHIIPVSDSSQSFRLSRRWTATICLRLSSRTVSTPTAPMSYILTAI